MSGGGSGGTTCYTVTVTGLQHRESGGRGRSQGSGCGGGTGGGWGPRITGAVYMGIDGVWSGDR